MSSDQIKALLELEVPAQKVDEPIQEVDSPSQDTEPENILLPDDKKASEILSAPPPAEPIGVTAVLKTRKDLIHKISEICERRGEDPKPLNLKRRRKKSLENILATKFAEAAEEEARHEIHPELESVLPEGMEARTQFAVDMAFRLDLTLCALLERSVQATDGWHGLSADGFAQSIESNETLSGEIRQCWLEILNEPENEWVLDACTTGTRLFLCHVYGFMNVIHKTKKQHVSYPNFQSVAPRPEQRIQKNARPDVAPRAAPGKLRRVARERAARRQDHVTESAVHSGAGGVVKTV